MNNALMNQFGFKIEANSSMPVEKIQDEISLKVKEIFKHQKESMGPYFEQISKMIMLTAIDQRWKEHLYTIDKVKEGINLRAYGQKDPLIEYKKEAFKAFEYLSNIIKTETVEKMMRVQLVPEAVEEAVEKLKPHEADEVEMNYSAPSDSADSFSDLANPQQPMQGRGPVSEAPTKRRMVGGPPRESERVQNRAERRKQKGR
jgi:preprotein translocase subunit SecA